MPALETRYIGRRCDAVDRDGNRCELPTGHADRGSSPWHRSSWDDRPRVWTVR